jgi:hypothetical protein
MHLVIPFASALSDASQHAVGTLSLPNLERLLARWTPADAADSTEADEYTLSMPHERLVARLRGWDVVDGLLPFAAEAARADGLAPAAGSGWALLTPAHWHVGREQINLLDPATLALAEDEARALHATLAPLFEDLGWRFHWGSASRWYASHESLARLPSASIDRVIGRNVDLWLNDHPDILLVRRLQSEAQMLLYTHPVNDERAARGEPTMNSFWLSGTGPAAPAGTPLPADVTIAEGLRAPALAEDWSTWAEAWHALDEGPVRALAEDAVARPQESHALSLAGERVVRTWRPAPRPWWKNLLGARAVHAQPLLAAL